MKKKAKFSQSNTNTVISEQELDQAVGGAASPVEGEQTVAEADGRPRPSGFQIPSKYIYG